MTTKSDEVQKARWSLIRYALDKVYNVPSYSNLYSNAFCVIAHLGLQLKTKEKKKLMKIFEYSNHHNHYRKVILHVIINRC